MDGEGDVEAKLHGESKVIQRYFDDNNNDNKRWWHGAAGTASANADIQDVDYTEGGSSKGGGKKKGKKGKKVSPSVLGFNVVSNRIMMGEIQSVED